jgi:hypothetical protein
MVFREVAGVQELQEFRSCRSYRIKDRNGASGLDFLNRAMFSEKVEKGASKG